MREVVSEGRMATVPANTRTLARIIVAGALGLVIWEIFARLVAPLWLGFELDPTGLIEMSIGVSGMPAMWLHIMTGLVAFPAAYMLVVHPAFRAIVPGLPWPVAGGAYGVALWVFAMYVMASLLGGMPAFMGFAPIAWASLVGHVGLGLGIAAATAYTDRDAA